MTQRQLLCVPVHLRQAVNKQFILLFFLLSEAVIILAFNYICGLTIDVRKYLAVVLACQNALSLGMPLSIIFKLSLIVIKDFFLVLS